MVLDGKRGMPVSASKIRLTEDSCVEPAYFWRRIERRDEWNS